MSIVYTDKGILINNELILLGTITNNVNKEKIRKSNLGILTITMPPSRNDEGIIEEICLPLDDIYKLVEFLKLSPIYFGDIFGKYSDISIHLDDDNMIVSSSIYEVVAFMNDNPSGHSIDHHSFIETLIENIENGDDTDLYNRVDELRTLVKF
jgi:hypothetical protein